MSTNPTTTTTTTTMTKSLGKYLLFITIVWLRLSSDLVVGVRKRCETSMDCNQNQCCTETPLGIKLCLEYLQAGELCFFRYRTPSCGCASGLKCVSTSPMQPGDWNHDYVCAKVRPFQHHKLMPYLDDPELNELSNN